MEQVATVPRMQIAASTIDAVTVYREGARVRRRLSVEGQTRVRVAPLPLALDDDSIRVFGQAKVSDVRVVLTTVDAQPDLAPPQDAALQAARLVEAEASARVEVVKRELAALDALVLGERRYGKTGPDGIPIAQRLQLIAFRREQSERLTAELRTLREALRSASEERKELEEQKRLATTARQTRPDELRKGIDLTLERGRGELFVEYAVPGARWAPSYVLRFDGQLSSVQLQMRAHVAQRTGEDWSDVALRLSTAKLHRWTDLPELASVRIGRRQPSLAKRGWRVPPQGADALYADYDRVFGAGTGPDTDRPPAPEVAANSTAMLSAPVAMAGPPGPPGISGGPPMVGSPPPAMAPAPPMQAQAMEADAMVRRSKGGALPGAAPRPVRAQMKHRRSRSAAGSAPAPLSAMSAPNDLAFGERLESGLGAGPNRAELDPAERLLAYGRLRMGAPSSPTRGQLQLVRRDVLYVELLREEGRVLAGRAAADLTKLLRRAAQHTHTDPLPAQCIPPHTEDGFDYAFDAAFRVDIPSDGSFHALSAQEQSTAAKGHYLVVPRETTDVFRFVSFANPLDGPVLRGPADVYVDGRYLLTREMQVAAPRGELEFGLGVEEAIKVARNTRFEEKSAGLMSRSLELVHELTIEIANRLTADAQVEVRERIPVSRKDDDDVEVHEERVSPSWEPWSPKDRELRGGRRWLVRVSAGGESRLQATYVVRISAKKELVGGNRRER